LRRVIDDEDGSVLEVTCPPDTSRLGMLVSGVGNRVETLGNGDIVNMAKHRYDLDEIEHLALEIYDIDAQTMRHDTPYIHSIVHNTGNEYDFGSFLFWKLNKDTMVMHFTKENLEDKKKSPGELKLVMADISEKSRLGVIKEKVITDVVYYPQHQFNDDIWMDVKDDNIIISQRVYKDAITSPFVIINWIAWYDKNFELQAKLYELKNAQGEYYSWIKPIGVKDGVLYYF
ncbi:hypothetical protein RZS08_09325, partial [Arthrospira platensis SPKY1]|nr:hypothetical protein [Arthrospira platensis SPKY1]